MATKKVTSDQLDPKEEKMLDWILNAIVIFVLGWLGLEFCFQWADCFTFGAESDLIFSAIFGSSPIALLPIFFTTLTAFSLPK